MDVVGGIAEEEGLVQMESDVRVIGETLLSCFAFVGRKRRPPAVDDMEHYHHPLR